MAEFLDRDLRVNQTTEALRTLRAGASARVSSIPVSRGFTTAPNGQVLDRLGNIIYTPTQRDKRTP